MKFLTKNIVLRPSTIAYFIVVLVSITTTYLETLSENVVLEYAVYGLLEFADINTSFDSHATAKEFGANTYNHIVLGPKENKCNRYGAGSKHLLTQPLLC